MDSGNPLVVSRKTLVVGEPVSLGWGYASRFYGCRFLYSGDHESFHALDFSEYRTESLLGGPAGMPKKQMEDFESALRERFAVAAAFLAILDDPILATPTKQEFLNLEESWILAQVGTSAGVGPPPPNTSSTMRSVPPSVYGKATSRA
jgi:hypothetical protein